MLSDGTAMVGLSVAYATEANIKSNGSSGIDEPRPNWNVFRKKYLVDEQYCTAPWSAKFHGGSITARSPAIIGD